ncbi:HPr kinase/phosphorylase [Poseidonocella sedimentorum]|uniref:Hpr(Ser) kinase/phosphatase n=1 Tax=Poseidonocella sedimentorum TaxID=871652 RepID=A0A1I6ELS5_9RHOB|nr:HPr kinase/phosphatase C-terminal domain-containing protein [Poseidonocella sedimentorum]SFR18699.1 Hpr(Ser) kinase/phosphatase [Poseidonocella sedimentorum]
MKRHEIIHATAVEAGGRAALLIGPSGSGKSALALALIAHGARLVSDDRTRIERRESGLYACPPDWLAGVIEARGVGLLRAPVAPPSPTTVVVDMGQVETERLPPRRSVEIMDVSLALLHKVETQHFAAAVLAYLTHGPFE